MRLSPEILLFADVSTVAVQNSAPHSVAKISFRTANGISKGFGVFTNVLEKTANSASSFTRESRFSQ
jgi:hypothetical protein